MLKKKTFILDTQEREKIDEVVAFLRADKPIQVDWKIMHSMTDLISECKFVRGDPNVDVPWESNMGRIIRKNKVGLRVFKKPESGNISVDKTTLSMILRGVADENLNVKLTNEFRLIDLVSGNMF